MEDASGSFESLSSIKPNVLRLDPFWATRLWQRLINHTKECVKIYRQRYFLKIYDNVFNGEDLVNVVFQFLKECKGELDVERVSRSKAIKVCQVLMEKKLFESVAPKYTLKFEDSSTRFYRFIDEQNRENAEDNENKENISHIQQEESDPFLPCKIDSITPSEFKRCSKRRSLRIKTPLLRVKNTKPSPVHFSRCIDREIDQEADLTLRDTALALLLQMIEVPILEIILQVPYDMPELPEAPQPFVLENDFTPRKIQPVKTNFRGPVADLSWVKASSNCLEGRYPAGIAGLWSVQACKILCYRSVVERFACSAEALIPGEYFSLCIPIVRILEGDSRRKAHEALQLLLFHLPWRRRKQLHNLLHFLHLVVEDIFVRVDKKITNYDAVLRDFLHIIFKHPLVSNETKKILFDYLLLKSESLFKISPKLQKFKNCGFVFCKNIENWDENFVSQYTERCLSNLAFFVADSTKIKLSDKKTWVKKLKKHHPAAYIACKFEES